MTEKFFLSIMSAYTYANAVASNVEAERLSKILDYLTAIWCRSQQEHHLIVK
jgi:hypothetical protein